MIRPRNLVLLTIIACGTGGISAFGSAANVYVTPTGTATGNCPAGTASAPNLTPAQFNASGSWGTGTGKIGPGTVVLVCGTITGTPNTNILTFQGSGSSGNPIILRFDTGAIVQTTACAQTGCIYSDGQYYLTIDGANTGIVQATSVGTSGSSGCISGSCSTQQGSDGVQLIQCNGCTIENLTVRNMYVRTSNSDEPGAENSCIQVRNDGVSGATNTMIKNNIVTNCGLGIIYGYGNSDGGLVISGNNVSLANWLIAVKPYSGSDNISSGQIYGNVLHDTYNWDDNPSPYNFHHNYVALFNGVSPSTLTGMAVYNNEYYGDFGNGTGMNYLDNNSNGNSSVTFFNNYVHMATGTGTAGGNGAFTCQSESGTGTVTCKVYNNTVVGVNTIYAIWLQGSTVAASDIRNNVISSWNTLWYLTSSAAKPSPENYNDWYSPSPGGNGIWDNSGAGYSSLVTWQTATGLDENSVLGNPLLNANGTLNPGSPAIGLGTNLTSLCTGNLTALCSDKAGNPRPASGAWDAGAFVYTGPASGLTAAGH